MLYWRWIISKTSQCELEYKFYLEHLATLIELNILKDSNYCFNYLLIRLWSKDLKHLILGNELPGLQLSNGYSNHFIYPSLFDIKVMFVWNSHDSIKMHFTLSNEKSDLAQHFSLKKTPSAFLCDADKFKSLSLREILC